MKDPVGKFYAFLDRPLRWWARIALLVLVIPLVLSFWFPLWRIGLVAPQYPDGLYVDIYSYTLVGGNHGQHLDEINTLNHYVGMQHIDRRQMSDLDWMPFAIGILCLITLRTAAIGTVRSLIDLNVLMVYALGFMFARFVYKLYVLGHNLSHEAPLRMEPFMPALFGRKTIANFEETSYPQFGAVLMGLFALGVVAVLVVHLVSGRRQASRAERVTVPIAPDMAGVPG